MANAILGYLKKPLAQVELYAALKAARAELPRDPEAFGYGCTVPDKQGLVTKFRARWSKT